MCMVPTARTVREGKYETTAGVVKFRVGESGSIVFLAPITRSLPAERYTLRAHVEREDPVESNRFPHLLGTNVLLRRRRIFQGGVEDVLVIATAHGASLLRGSNTFYTVDGPAENLNDGIDVETYFYWLQLEVQQESPATAQTLNSVIGLELL